MKFQPLRQYRGDSGIPDASMEPWCWPGPKLQTVKGYSLDYSLIYSNPRICSDLSLCYFVAADDDYNPTAWILSQRDIKIQPSHTLLIFTLQAWEKPLCAPAKALSSFVLYRSQGVVSCPFQLLLQLLQWAAPLKSIHHPDTKRARKEGMVLLKGTLHRELLCCGLGR